ncbi:AAA family ATPase [Kribbella deserti]|uniref:AAA family ATPase n=1 Tax=Kribbella deserti TaxID=1926257 RepID=A0ABV6QDS8_9ACTN
MTAKRSLTLHSQAGKELPRIDAFADLYLKGVRPRHGDVIMIAGRSGTQKSGLALFWTANMNLPTLYFSADMSPFTASTRLASLLVGETTGQVEKGMTGPGRSRYLDALAESQISFAFGSPITWTQIDEEIDAYVELWNAYPRIVAFDNLMDFQGAQADYQEQMTVMQGITELAHSTGITPIVMHHASDKGWEAKTNPWNPPSRDQIKGGLSEKPSLSLSVALDPTTLDYRIACIKQRMGPSDPTASSYAVLRAEPDKTRFHALGTRLHRASSAR